VNWVGDQRKCDRGAYWYLNCLLYVRTHRRIHTTPLKVRFPTSRLSNRLSSFFPIIPAAASQAVWHRCVFSRPIVNDKVLKVWMWIFLWPRYGRTVISRRAHSGTTFRWLTVTPPTFLWHEVQDRQLPRPPVRSQCSVRCFDYVLFAVGYCTLTRWSFKNPVSVSS